MEPILCTICKQADHRANKCPALHDPIKEGFHSGGGGGGGHSHEEEDAFNLLRILEAQHSTMKNIIPL